MELGIAEETFEEKLGGDADELYAGEGGDVCGSRGFVEDGHFAEEFAFAEDGEGDVAVAGLTADFGPAGDDEVDGVAPGVFHEYGASGRAFVEGCAAVQDV